MFAYSVFGTFLARFRMFDEASSPVRTPSYMPKATVQLAWMKNRSKADEEKDPTGFLEGPIEMWLINAIPFGHHSNGQNGCLFVGQVRVDDECVPQPPVATTRRRERRERQFRPTTPDWSRVSAPVSAWRRSEGPSRRDAPRMGHRRQHRTEPHRLRRRLIPESLRPLYGPPVPRDGRRGARQLPCACLAAPPGPLWGAWADGEVLFIQGAAPSVENDTTSVRGGVPAGSMGRHGALRQVRLRPGLLQRSVPAEHQPRPVRTDISPREVPGISKAVGESDGNCG